MTAPPRDDAQAPGRASHRDRTAASDGADNGADNGADWGVRRATTPDAPALSVLGQATFLEAFAADIPGPDLIAHCRHQHAQRYYDEALAQADTHAWIAELAATRAPMGYALVRPPDIPEIDTRAGDLELKRIYVLWRFFGTGVGAALMACARDHARAAGAQRLLLGVYGDNHRAVAFYHRQGFAIIGTRRFRVGDRTFDDAVMAAAL